jgi:hypothetical protein
MPAESICYLYKYLYNHILIVRFANKLWVNTFTGWRKKSLNIS